MYKIQNKLVPDYLANLGPARVSQTNPYQLRDPSRLIIPHSRTAAFKRSFIPSATRLWNGLEPSIRSLPGLPQFKTHIKVTKCTHQKHHLYSVGRGYGALQQSRMRMGLSGLNFHRHKYNFIESSQCLHCNNPREDPLHYFLECPAYQGQTTIQVKLCWSLFSTFII